ncbi:MAG: hypothetical protein AMS24_00595 [Chlamydiae bacterium SM23_39]|nr:MAG: hypothetical protein AMS24_00595 [Chlamydiae bacterium SM23_39]
MSISPNFNKIIAPDKVQSQKYKQQCLKKSIGFVITTVASVALGLSAYALLYFIPMQRIIKSIGFKISSRSYKIIQVALPVIIGSSPFVVGSLFLGGKSVFERFKNKEDLKNKEDPKIIDIKKLLKELDSMDLNNENINEFVKKIKECFEEKEVEQMLEMLKNNGYIKRSTYYYWENVQKIEINEKHKDKVKESIKQFLEYVLEKNNLLKELDLVDLTKYTDFISFFEKIKKFDAEYSKNMINYINELEKKLEDSYFVNSNNNEQIKKMIWYPDNSFSLETLKNMLKEFLKLF